MSPRRAGARSRLVWAAIGTRILRESVAVNDSEEPFANVIEFLVNLVRERRVIVEWYRGPEYVGSSALRRGEPRPGPSRADRRVTLSWTGPYEVESTGRSPRGRTRRGR